MKESRFYPFGSICGWSLVRVIGAPIRKHYYILQQGDRRDSTTLYVDIDEFHEVLKDYLTYPPELVEKE